MGGMQQVGLVPFAVLPNVCQVSSCRHWLITRLLLLLLLLLLLQGC
jgi:hypothetical protein